MYIDLLKVTFLFRTWCRGRLIWRSRFLMAVWSSQKSKGALQSPAWPALSTSSGPDRVFSHSHSSLGGKIWHSVKTHTHMEKRYWHIRLCWGAHYTLCHSALPLYDGGVSRRKWAVKEPHQLLICRAKARRVSKMPPTTRHPIIFSLNVLSQNVGKFHLCHPHTEQDALQNLKKGCVRTCGCLEGNRQLILIISNMQGI